MRLWCISRYRSALGSFDLGQAVDVNEHTGELLLRDSPGSFSREEPSEETVSGLIAHDRRARGGRTR